MTEFEDIRLTGFDRKTATRHGADTALWNIPLSLSAAPSEDWKRIFDAEWATTIYSLKLHAIVSGRSILISGTRLEDVEVHIEQLKKVLPRVNERYREYLSRLMSKEHREQQRQETDEAALDALEKKLNFDE